MEESLELSTISSLLENPDDIVNVIPKFSGPLKTNYEDPSLWLRLGLALSLVKNRSKSPQSALQAFHECLRIGSVDPLPAMLAAKLMLEILDDPEDGLELAEEAIKRCKKLIPKKVDGHNPVLSKCYLLASIMHAQIYEREPEYNKQSKTCHLEASLDFLNLAIEQNDGDHLNYFHQALHHASKKSYRLAIDSLRRSIELNAQHVPSFHLMILCLSALKLFNEALELCESTLHEFQDNLLLLYIKCNLERSIVETRGYKVALGTAQHILKIIRAKRNLSLDVHSEDSQQQDQTKVSTNLFPDDISCSNLPNHDPYSEELTIWLLVAEIFIKIGSIADAELCVDEASIHATGALSHQILFVRGLISKAKNNLIEAKSFFQSCLALYPRHLKALQQIGYVHYLLGNHSIAEKFLRDSLDLDHDNHKTWHYLSLVCIQTNQHDKAKECEKKATTLEETCPVIPLSTVSRLTLK